jgi:ubiquinone/menaquinone biosynthesis C-methylase UbiE
VTEPSSQTVHTSSTEVAERFIFERFRAPENENIVGLEIDDSDFMLQSLLRNLGNLNGKVILDAGCGKGKFVRALSRHGAAHVIGIDPTPSYLQTGQGLKDQARSETTHFTCGSLTCLPLAPGTVDAIICCEVIEHIPKAEDAFVEMHRVLKPGGLVLIIDKQVHALHTRFFIPVRLWKWLQEKRGAWMYPANSLFREIWYGAQELNRIMSRHFDVLPPEYLYAPGRSAFLFRKLPRWTWLYCCWKGRKSS